jgi:hypothetical protein
MPTSGSSVMPERREQRGVPPADLAVVADLQVGFEGAAEHVGELGCHSRVPPSRVVVPAAR